MALGSMRCVVVSPNKSKKTSKSQSCNREVKKMFYLDRRSRTALLLYLASIVEKADEQILPAVYKYIGSSLHATPTQLGTITLCRALVQVTLNDPKYKLGISLVRVACVADDPELLQALTSPMRWDCLTTICSGFQSCIFRSPLPAAIRVVARHEFFV